MPIFVVVISDREFAFEPSKLQLNSKGKSPSETKQVT